MMSNAFDPLEFGFKRVNMNPPGYTVYEKDLGDLTKENPDFLRLNIFLGPIYLTSRWSLARFNGHVNVAYARMCLNL